MLILSNFLNCYIRRNFASFHRGRHTTLLLSCCKAEPCAIFCDLGCSLDLSSVEYFHPTNVGSFGQPYRNCYRTRVGRTLDEIFDHLARPYARAEQKKYKVNLKPNTIIVTQKYSCRDEAWGLYYYLIYFKISRIFESQYSYKFYSYKKGPLRSHFLGIVLNNFQQYFYIDSFIISIDR